MAELGGAESLLHEIMPQHVRTLSRIAVGHEHMDFYRDDLALMAEIMSTHGLDGVVLYLHPHEQLFHARDFSETVMERQGIIAEALKGRGLQFKHSAVRIDNGGPWNFVSLQRLTPGI